MWGSFVFEVDMLNNVEMEIQLGKQKTMFFKNDVIRGEWGFWKQPSNHPTNEVFRKLAGWIWLDMVGWLDGWMVG